MPKVSTRGAFKVSVTGEHRTGLGRLIAKTYSIQPPAPPQCLSTRCLYRFFMDTLFCALLSNYHSRRVAYAEKNRNKDILERYRTGEPSPKTIWQAIHANIKLKCPVCRKYIFRR